MKSVFGNNGNGHGRNTDSRYNTERGDKVSMDTSLHSPPMSLESDMDVTNPYHVNPDAITQLFKRLRMECILYAFLFITYAVLLCTESYYYYVSRRVCREQLQNVNDFTLTIIIFLLLVYTLFLSIACMNYHRCKRTVIRTFSGHRKPRTPIKVLLNGYMTRFGDCINNAVQAAKATSLSTKAEGNNKLSIETLQLGKTIYRDRQRVNYLHNTISKHLDDRQTDSNNSDDSSTRLVHALNKIHGDVEKRSHNIEIADNRGQHDSHVCPTIKSFSSWSYHIGAILHLLPIVTLFFWMLEQIHYTRALQKNTAVEDDPTGVCYGAFVFNWFCVLWITVQNLVVAIPLLCKLCVKNSDLHQDRQ